MMYPHQVKIVLNFRIIIEKLSSPILLLPSIIQNFSKISFLTFLIFSYHTYNINIWQVGFTTSSRARKFLNYFRFYQIKFLKMSGLKLCPVYRVSGLRRFYCIHKTTVKPANNIIYRYINWTPTKTGQFKKLSLALDFQYIFFHTRLR